MKKQLYQSMRKLYIERQLLINNVAALITITMLVVSICGFIFTSYLQTTLSEYIVNSNSMQLDKIRADIDGKLLEANRLTYKIENMADITPPQIRNNKLQSLQSLGTLRNISQSISGIIMYYGDYEQYLTFNGYCSAEVLQKKYGDYPALYKAITTATKPQFYHSDEFLFQMEEDHILFVLPVVFETEAPSLICTYLYDEDTFWNAAGSAADANELLFMYDSQRKLILTNQENSNDIGEQIANQLDTQTPLRDWTAGDTEYSLSKTICSNGITIVRLINKASILAPIYSGRRFLFILMLCVLVPGSMLIIFTVERNYRPIQRLLMTYTSYSNGNSQEGGGIAPQNEVSRIKSSLEKLYQENISIKHDISKSAPALLDYFVANAIKGRFSDVTEFNAACGYLGVSFTHSYFCVCVIVAGETDAARENLSDLDMCIRLRNILPDDIEGHFCRDSFDSLRKKCYYGVLCFEYDWHVVFHTKLTSMKNQFMERYGINLTISCGEMLTDIAMLPKSFINARFTAKYCLINGDNSVISPAQVSATSHYGVVYPYQEIMFYKEVLSKWDLNDIRNAIQKIIERINAIGTTLLVAECVCIDIIGIFIRTAKIINNDTAMEIGQYFDPFFISEFSSISEITSIIKVLHTKIEEFIAANSVLTSPPRVAVYVEYLQKNVGNNQFSINDMANEFGISPQHLRKIFKAETGYSLLECVTDMKIEKAKELLTSSNMSVADIVVELGNVDASSFIRKFKNKVGLTPGQYREKYSPNQPQNELAATFSSA